MRRNIAGSYANKIKVMCSEKSMSRACQMHVVLIKQIGKLLVERQISL